MRRSTLMFALAMVLLLVGNSFSMAQPLSWEEIGPNNTGNHVRAIAVGSNGTVWAGSVGGGLWKSTDEGSSWSQVTGLADNLAVSCISVDGDNIYVGTGEAYYYRPESTWGGNWAADSLGRLKNAFLRFSSQPGEGVFVSNDGGTTWDHDNGTWNGSSVRYTGEFISIQEVASKGGRTLVGTLKGLYWSDNADLTTVTKSTGTNAFVNGVITDVDFANGNVVYAATKDSLYRSSNGGQSFGAAINTTVPYGTQAPNNRLGGHRIELAVAPSNADIIYLTGVNDITGNCTGVWRSLDNGFTWVTISPYESATFKPFQNKGLYSMFLGVPPADPNTCFIGGTKMYKFTTSSGWTDAASHTYIPGFSTNYVPVPQLGIAFASNSDSTFYVSTDKEIVRTSTLSRTFSFRTKGFNNAHLYAISASPSWRVLVSDRFNGLSMKETSASSQGQQQFNSIHPASLTGGGFARWSVTNPDYILCTKGEDRGVQRSLTLGASFEDFYGLPVDSVDPCFGVNPDSMLIDRATTNVGGGGVYDRSTAPIMPFHLDEYIAPSALGNDTSIQNSPIYLFFASGNFVWVCQNPFGGIDSLPTWNRISNDLITQNLPGGKKKYITAITTSGDANHTVYVGTNAGEVFRILRGHEPSFLCVDTDVSRIDGGALPNRWITDIEVDPTNVNNVIVTFGAFATGDDRVFITNDAMAVAPTFRSIQGDLEANLPVHSAAFHPDATRKSIVIGTEEGLYITYSDYETVGAIDWSNESSAFGNVPVTDVNYRRYYIDFIDGANYKYVADNTLFIATHGRGAFKSTTLVSRPEGQFGDSDITIKAGPNPAVTATKITFDLPQVSEVQLTAYGLDGRPVAQLADGRFGAGATDVVFNTKDLAAGMYLVKAVFTNTSGVYQTNLRIVVVK
jgi:hypothetical protein